MISGFSQKPESVTVKRTMELMGSRFDITVLAIDEELGYINIEEAAAEIKRIEKMISSWDEDVAIFKMSQGLLFVCFILFHTAELVCSYKLPQHRYHIFHCSTTNNHTSRVVVFTYFFI